MIPFAKDNRQTGSSNAKINSKSTHAKSYQDVFAAGLDSLVIGGGISAGFLEISYLIWAQWRPTIIYVQVVLTCPSRRVKYFRRNRYNTGFFSAVSTMEAGFAHMYPIAKFQRDYEQNQAALLACNAPFGLPTPLSDDVPALCEANCQTNESSISFAEALCGRELKPYGRHWSLPSLYSHQEISQTCTFTTPITVSGDPTEEGLSANSTGSDDLPEDATQFPVVGIQNLDEISTGDVMHGESHLSWPAEQFQLKQESSLPGGDEYWNGKMPTTPFFENSACDVDGDDSKHVNLNSSIPRFKPRSTNWRGKGGRCPRAGETKKLHEIPLKRKSHNQTEREYRNKLNDKFRDLCLALGPLPMERGYAPDPVHGTRALSKAEILDLSKERLLALQAQNEILLNRLGEINISLQNG